MTDADEAVEMLAELARRLPIPGGTWHPYNTTITRIQSDLAVAAGVLAGDSLARRRLAAAVERDEQPPAAPPLSGPLAAAWANLTLLPYPEGRHPFIDEIVPTLLAARLALVVIASSPAAERLFAARRREA